VRDEKRRSDIQLVSAAMQNVINTIAQLNGMEAPTFIMEDGSGLELDRANRDKILVDGGMLKFTPEYLVEKYGFEESDFVITQDSPKPTQSAPATLSANFSASQQQFTPAQQAIEDVSDSALAATKSPIDASLIRTAVLAATSPEDLEHRLSLLINQRDAHFQDVLAQAIFTADVIGYVSNEKGLS
jgi:hypothetical protein